MKRATIVEDWSRFNRAVLEAADGVVAAGASRQPPRQPKREAVDLVSEPPDSGDRYGLISRHKWRKHA